MKITLRDEVEFGEEAEKALAAFRETTDKLMAAGIGLPALVAAAGACYSMILGTVLGCASQAASEDVLEELRVSADKALAQQVDHQLRFVKARLQGEAA